MNDLTHLADLVRIRNYVNNSVSQITGRPAETGQIAEYLAGQIFDIDLHETFVFKASDGKFRSPVSIADKSVNVKYRSSSSRRLNLVESRDPHDHPAYYLAFRGPKMPKAPANERTLPLVIEAVYLFSSAELVQSLIADGVNQIGPSVRKEYWDKAMIYPAQVNQTLILTEEQRAALRLFAPQPA